MANYAAAHESIAIAGNLPQYDIRPVDLTAYTAYHHIFTLGLDLGVLIRPDCSHPLRNTRGTWSIMLAAVNHLDCVRIPTQTSASLLRNPFRATACSNTVQLQHVPIWTTPLITLLPTLCCNKPKAYPLAFFYLQSVAVPRQLLQHVYIQHILCLRSDTLPAHGKRDQPRSA